MSINITCNEKWEVTGYATLGRLVGGFDVEEGDYPQSLLSDFVLTNYSYDFDEGIITKTKDEAYQEVPEAGNVSLEDVSTKVDEQDALLQAQQATIVSQAKELALMKKQIAMLALSISNGGEV